MGSHFATYKIVYCFQTKCFPLPPVLNCYGICRASGKMSGKREVSNVSKQKRYPLWNPLVFQGTSPIMPIRGNNTNQKWSRIARADKSDSAGESVVMVTTSGTPRRAPSEAPFTANKTKQTSASALCLYLRRSCSLQLSAGPCEEQGSARHVAKSDDISSETTQSSCSTGS